MAEKQILFNDLARRAVAEYGLAGYTLIFIRHSDNVTLRAELIKRFLSDRAGL